MQKRPTDRLWFKLILFSMMTGFIFCFLILPIFVVLIEAFKFGLSGYWQGLTRDFDTSDSSSWWEAILTTSSPTLSAIRLSFEIAIVVVPVNTLFGIAAAWLVTHFRFPSKSLLITLIELPLWISPVVGGLVFILVFGEHGWFGHWLRTHGFQIVYAYPGMVLATAFVTFPFVARSLIPLMQSLGRTEEEAALTLGANGWQVFWRVTFPKIKWGILYGALLCNARALGEFGAVSVVSGSIVGQTLTMPLQVEQFSEGINYSDAFVLASLLLLLGLVTLILKTVLDRTRLTPLNKHL